MTVVTARSRKEISWTLLSPFCSAWFAVDASSLRPPHAKVSVTLPDGGLATGSFTGDGPIDAVFQVLNVATGLSAKRRKGSSVAHVTCFVSGLSG